jgi:hypothetical protein
VSEDLPKDYIPAWLERRLLFYAAQQEHRWLAERLRGKAASPDEAALRREADDMVRQNVGAFPYEEPHDPYANAQEDAELEASMRNLADGYFERLRESESYAWGLAIVGIFHLWERDARNVVAALSRRTASKLEKIQFKRLCALIEATGFDITASTRFGPLESARLISNTIKHGGGSAARELLEKQPELFPGVKNAAGLRVGRQQFEQIADAIYQLWREYEDAYVATESVPNPN